MGVQVLRLSHDQYVLWSNTVDAPVSRMMNREQMVAAVLREDVPPDQAAELMATVDRIGSSDPTRPLAEVLAENRAGPDESWLSVEEIIRVFAEPT